ncbi:MULTISPECIES: Gfo/Idh/MocA family oxidoreductase [unclassified Paenibacillus]|uniref:Gfo/Idh/MocA family protein n=1 Tax=unclassified Paenibacillus TaxID=185978 RepID=UPI00240648EC|nr:MULTISPECIES: Gfo/Idh/MocA family oxidoreductase [unclassified Paenibacillus]MDF9842496.1 dihydrodiol dehydrogenase / D-xylose 1-dehydrogenase (NADP) [Paenibacillus sp. PastF-2]MDF9849086.1 dihydrodiol dehydrogenase / D-xylose 1-dehydrogenase (NADP) [Paenibacillus sp. PastM-2]MDF9855656.1 dihydrodiol dehydrogenase / D-xylose 1-dehydrogenase (NADP) [Paenibacillus sp. PastF-1]MDH6480928.1 dihydrodiol dehydrogenase / D-xylose 1-dehydrogenase (NADP) [Paenibacillus sp. PastH-2]MDH6508350.1 dihyd
MTNDNAYKIKWGILSTGWIAHKFATDLAHASNGVAYAVGSRSQESADEFARNHGIPVAYATYEELVSDPEVDAIYIGTPHPFHKENALLALRAGKAVLCEKPFTVNSAELEEVVAYAREHKLFLMEAMWSRYIPAIVKVREWIAAGRIGDVRLVKADLGFRSDWNPQGRLLNPELGGGALLDVGIYPVSFASMILGPHPESVSSTVHIGETGVDEHFSLLLSYADGKSASLNGGIRLTLTEEAHVFGTEGYIVVKDTLVNPRAAELYIGGELAESFEQERASDGYCFEAEEVGRCLQAGLTESPVMTLDESVAIMKLLDQVRAQWGLKYPGEK